MKRKAEPDAEEMTSSKGPSTSKKLAPDANNDFINETSRRARGNWACLAEKMRRSTRPPRRAKKSDRSLRSTLRLFSMTSSDSEAEDDVYSLCVRDSPFCIDIALPEDRTSLRHITGFDNTGNVRIWPGGEALAYYLSIRPPLVSGKLVLELGAGLVGLPGFIAAIYATRVRITDGNEHSVASLKDIAKRNPLPNVEIELLRWGSGTDEKKFDLILAADCVFFSEYHEDLVNTFDSFGSSTYLQELQKSIQVSVLKSADAIVEQFAKQGDNIEFDADVLSHVSALVWDTVSDDWTADLLAFSGHAGRETVNVFDVALLMRRNNQLLELVSKAADVDVGGFERPVAKRQRTNKETTKTKRANAKAGTTTPGTALNTSVQRDRPAAPFFEANTASTNDVKERKYPRKRSRKDTAAADDEVVVISPPSKQLAATEKQEVVDENDVPLDAVTDVAEPKVRHTPEPTAIIAPEFDEDEFLSLDVNLSRLKPLVSSTPINAPTTITRPLPSMRECGTSSGIRSRAPTFSVKRLKEEEKGGDEEAMEQDQNNQGETSNTVPKSPSPDLFSTPVKGSNSSDEFDFCGALSANTERNEGNAAPSRMAKDVETSAKKAVGGWSTKFSEFSFFDSVVVDATKDSEVKEEERRMNKQEQPADSSKSKQDPSSASRTSSGKRKADVSQKDEVDEEIREAEKILNAFLCYGLYAREITCRTMMSFKQLSSAHKDIILSSHNDHMRKVIKCVDSNQE
ncbi:hypothetical protein Q1695_013252 [Nippostrongylus brasiliensis]|nr:hypothetical protein Q1695_013252 [Nippostrongylus brasiliensis]